MLTQEELKAALRYDPETGVFVRLKSHGNQYPAGGPAGYALGPGYICITIARKSYYAHRLAWLYMTGAWPVDQIDHRNRNPSDNRWENLRVATCQENQWNVGPRRANKSGRKGVMWRPRDKVWVAKIRVGGRQKHLGTFHDPDSAGEAYRRAAELHFGEFARV